MPKETSISCDCCGLDLKWADNCVDWRLVLRNVSVPHPGGFATAMMAYPALGRDAYFCGLTCLRDWLNSSPDAARSHGGKLGGNRGKPKDSSDV